MLAKTLRFRFSAVVSVSIIAMASLGQSTAPEKKAYVRSGNEATVSGTITLIGKRPKPKRIDMQADPACYKLNRRPRTEWVEGTNDRLANVFVYLKGEPLENHYFEPPKSPAVLNHVGCRFVPHVLGMQTGQLMIFNHDPTFHNTHAVPKINSEWNRAEPAGGAVLTRTIELPEIFIPFKDNQHPWQKAYVSVLSHPFFAVSDQSGRYKITRLPPGHYTIIARHERLGEKMIEFDLLPGDSRNVNFSFDVKDGDFSGSAFTY